MEINVSREYIIIEILHFFTLTNSKGQLMMAGVKLLLSECLDNCKVSKSSVLCGGMSLLVIKYWTNGQVKCTYKIKRFGNMTNELRSKKIEAENNIFVH